MAQGLFDYLQSEKIKENLEDIKYQNERLQEIEEEKLRHQEQETKRKEKQYQDSLKKEKDQKKGNIDKAISSLFQDLYKHENNISNIDLHEVSNIKKHINQEYNSLKFKRKKLEFKEEKPELEQLKFCQKFSGLHFLGYLIVFKISLLMFFGGISFDKLIVELNQTGDFDLINMVLFAFMAALTAFVIVSNSFSSKLFDYIKSISIYSVVGGILGLWLSNSDILSYLYIAIGLIVGLLSLFMMWIEIDNLRSYKKLTEENEEIKKRNSSIQSTYDKARNKFLKEEKEKVLEEEKILKEKFQNTTSKELFTNYYLGKALQNTYKLMAKQNDKDKLDETILVFLDMFDINTNHLKNLNFILSEISQLKTLKK